ITHSGSFYVTTNLTGTAGRSGIIVQSDNVTLDLNGFALIGVAGSSNGIVCPGAQSNLVVRNGTIRDWGAQGVAASLVNQCRAERLSLLANGGQGIVAGPNAALEKCAAMANADSGIQAGTGSTLDDCVASQ